MDIAKKESENRIVRTRAIGTPMDNQVFTVYV